MNLPFTPSFTLDILDSNFNHLSHEAFILKLTTIGDKLEKHAIFREVPEHVPGFQMYRDMAQQYKTAVDAAEGGDRNRKAEKIAMRAQFQQNVDITRMHMVMVAAHRKDVSILNDTGFDFKHKAPYTRTSATSVPDTPPKPTVKRSGPGALAVTVAKPKGVATIEIQVTTEDPGNEAAWRDAIADVRARIELKNLEAMKRHYIRVRYRSAAGTSNWSEIVSEVVL